MAIGFKALGISANAQLPDEEEEISGGLWFGTVVVALLLAIGLFFVVPVGLTSHIKDQLGSSLLFWLVEGVLRTATAQVETPRIMTPSRTAWPPTGASRCAQSWPGFSPGASLSTTSAAAGASEAGRGAAGTPWCSGSASPMAARSASPTGAWRRGA